MAEDSLQGIEALLEEMQSERASADDFLDRSFGIIAVHGDKLAGWCLSEYNIGDRCEVGIATMRPFQRRGIATALATAFVGQARGHGIVRIGWHAWARNAGSLATAARAGFRHVSSYEALLAYFDPILDLAVNGDVFFRLGEYRQAAEWHERAIALGSAPVWVYWNAACAWAYIGNLDRSLALLNLAIDMGFHNADYIRDSEHLRPLHGSEGWGQLVDRLREGE